MAGHNFVHQIVGDLDRSARQVGQLTFDVGSSAQRESRQTQPGDPALKLLVEEGYRRTAERRRQCLVQERSGFLRREAQITRPDLDDLTFGAQARQRPGWIAARDQHQVQTLRPVAQQFAQKIVYSLATDHIVIIQHQDGAAGQALKLIAERN